MSQTMEYPKQKEQLETIEIPIKCYPTFDNHQQIVLTLKLKKEYKSNDVIKYHAGNNSVEGDARILKVTKISGTEFYEYTLVRIN